jgi:hypothetical protein
MFETRPHKKARRSVCAHYSVYSMRFTDAGGGSYLKVGCERYGVELLEKIIHRSKGLFGKFSIEIVHTDIFYVEGVNTAPHRAYLKVSYSPRKLRIQKIYQGWGFSEASVIEDLVFYKSDLKKAWKALI